MTGRAVWAIGCGQLVNWGVLYYAFGVLLVPLERDLGSPRWLVAGAFSLGLLVSAAAAPAVGRLADRGQGPAVIQAGGLVAAGLLIAWAAVPTIWMTYAVWAALGLCMAAILYEPVFAIVGRAFVEADQRLRAIATVTVMGGLASTVFLPSTAAVTDQWGWRAAVIVLAVAIALSTLFIRSVAFRNADGQGAGDLFRVVVQFGGHILRFNQPRPPVLGRQGEKDPRPLSPLVAVFAMSSITNSALSANLVAALIERGLTPTLAATVASLFGVMQLPGRLLMTHRAFTPGPFPLLVVSLALQVIGLVALMLTGSSVALWVGVVVFAGGAGLTTLARPYLVLHLYGPERAGYANGVIARGQQLARAAGPVSAAAMASVTGYGRVFAALSGLLVVAVILTVNRRSQ